MTAEDDYETIRNWTAKRAGGYITVTGTNQFGNPRRVTRVDRLCIVQGRVQAVTVDDVPYWLSLEARP